MDVDALRNVPSGNVDDMVFPAYLPADATDVRIVNFQIAGVALAPPYAISIALWVIAVRANEAIALPASGKSTGFRR